MANLVPVNVSRHGKKQLLPRTSWTFVAKQQATSLLLAEFPVAAHHLPIVFVRLQNAWSPAALLGLQRNANALVGSDGQWRGDYIPAILRRHPFALVRKETGSDEFVLCVDEEAGMLADEGGEPLFTADGKKTPALEKVADFTREQLGAVAAGELLTSKLLEHELLVPLQLKDRKGRTLDLKGISVVDEKKFNELPDEAFLALRAAGLLPAIYAHFFSLANLERIARLEAASA